MKELSRKQMKCKANKPGSGTGSRASAVDVVCILNSHTYTCTVLLKIKSKHNWWEQTEYQIIISTVSEASLSLPQLPILTSPPYCSTTFKSKCSPLYQQMEMNIIFHKVCLTILFYSGVEYVMPSLHNSVKTWNKNGKYW